MRVELNPVTLLMAPFVLLIRIIKVQITGELFAKAEGSGSLCLVFIAV